MFKHKTIISFDKIELRVGGMRTPEVYEIVCREDKAEISDYWESYENGGRSLNLRQSVTVNADDVIRLLNYCRVLRWDGFYGENPRGMLDGTTFSFTAEVNDGTKIQARGSNNFPKHYHDFTDALYAILNP